MIDFFGVSLPDWNIEEMTGYKPITTFYTDFSIADRFGSKAIKDTYKRASVSWAHDYKYMTELVMVLNWKIWEHHGKGDIQTARIYNDLWEKAQKLCIESFSKDELAYYYMTTD